MEPEKKDNTLLAFNSKAVVLSNTERWSGGLENWRGGLTGSPSPSKLSPLLCTSPPLGEDKEGRETSWMGTDRRGMEGQVYQS